MRVHTVTSSARSGYAISRPQREFARNSSDLGDAAIPHFWSGAINRKGYWSPTCDDKKWAVARDVGGRRRERRKEVALGRLITVSLILILGAWGGAAGRRGPRRRGRCANLGDPPAAARATDQVSGSRGAFV